MASGILFLTPKMENSNPDGLEVVAFNSVGAPHPLLQPYFSLVCRDGQVDSTP